MLSLSLSLSSVSEAENYTAMGVDGTVNWASCLPAHAWIRSGTCPIFVLVSTNKHVTSAGLVPSWGPQPVVLHSFEFTLQNHPLTSLRHFIHYSFI
jgi:hypothetical protein